MRFQSILAAVMLISAFANDAVVVSDVKRFTCGSGVATCLSEDGKRLYGAYLASTSGKGECHDVVALADIPIDEPEKAESFALVRKGEKLCGREVKAVVNGMSFMWKGKCRVTFDLNYDSYAWREWDPKTKKISGEGLFKVKMNGGIVPFSPAAISNFLHSCGFRDHNVYRERGDRMIAQARPVWYGDGKGFYGMATSSYSQPILFKCEDGETLEFMGVVPSICEYECQVEYLKGKFYAIGRAMKGDNFFVSDDGGKTFRGIGRLPDGKQRQRMAIYKGKLLIATSAAGVKAGKLRDGRNNAILLWGEGEELSKYESLANFVDPMGVVYFDIVPQGDAIHFLWSNAGRFPDYVKWGAVQGKDQVLYKRLEF